MIAAVLLPATLRAQQAVPGEVSAQTPELVIHATPRSPDQMAAFYEARGFPQDAIAAIRQACFVTVVMRNRGQQILWLELDNWQVRGEEGEVSRLPRAWWHAQWERLGVPLANRATFGWTLLPEVRDLRPGEPVGGNMTLSRVGAPFALEARFATGAKRDGPPLVVRLEHLRCPATGASP